MWLTRCFYLFCTCLVLVDVVAAAKEKQPLPVAVEARFKERITAKLSASLGSAISHMARALGIDAEGEAAFGTHYEFDLETVSWRRGCATDIAGPERDSVSYCAIRKLQALTAFCEVPAAVEEYREGVQRLLKQLLKKRDAVIAGLGMKRSLLPVGNGIEAWMSEVTPGSGNYDVVIPLHAAAMLTVVQCGSALNQTEVFSDVQAWFAAIQRVYMKEAWEQQSFHSNAILWESFVLISTMVRPGSSFAEELQDFLEDFELYLQAKFEKDTRVWSFSGSRAAVLNWAAAKKPSRRKKFVKTIDEYMKRWKVLAPQMNTKEMYTCGPLQGLAPLLLKRGDQAAELVSSVLALAEKDVDLFQVRSADDGSHSIAAGRLGDLFGKHGAELEGSFFRDEPQMKNEKRRSIRIDDTAQCILALARTLELLDDLIGVEVESPPDASAPPADAQGAQRTEL